MNMLKRFEAMFFTDLFFKLNIEQWYITDAIGENPLKYGTRNQATKEKSRNAEV